ncbi:alpha-tocopherol transfer protein-like [Phlebotomus argentipes]|uniref:alpha-tocopherol transfer protein-like n=1 Tax=Phlebotomus argentipes TaxID=94469 RepID=UPI002893828F|nr:alpha-tocopherol transfer protein-like [Phlebotomus argentipes]
MPNIRPLSEPLAKKAEKELFEVPERIDEDVTALRTWIAKQPHLRSRTDDQFLVTFLRGCKYSLERAKAKIDLYYTVRTSMKEMLMDRDPLSERNMELIRMGVGLPLPNTVTPDGPRIVLIRPGVYEPDKFSIVDIMRISLMANDMHLIEDDQMMVAGQIGILDLANTTMAHFLQFTPTLTKKMTVMNQEAMPIRLKGFHYINTPPGFETVYNMFKRFLNEKNRNRLHVHGDNMESLYQHIPQKLLPKEYGGEAGSIKDMIVHWEKKFIEFRDYFLEDDKYGTDEKKRPGRPKTEETIFGIDGSFRKLNVD